MSIETALYAYLSGQTALTTALGSGGIWQDEAAQGASLPRVVYTITGGEPTVSNAGPATLSRAEIDIECQGATLAVARTVRDALRPLVNGKGNMSWSGTTVYRCAITNEYDTYYPPVHNEQPGYYAKVISIEVDWYG